MEPPGCNGAWRMDRQRLLPFLPSCKRRVGLPANHVQMDVIKQPWAGPELPAEEYSTIRSKQPAFVPAPSGRVLVGAWSAPQESSTTTSVSRGAPSRQAYQLWHLDCDTSAPACATTPVATRATSWLTGTIAWHPAPRTAHCHCI